MAKILLVEDNEVNRDMLSRRLQRKGHEVITVGDGEQAVAFARSGRPDIILMDLNLPILDGPKVIHQARTELGLHALPIIAVSAGGESARRLALEAGANIFLDKPMRLRQVIDTMQRLLNIRAG